MDDSTHVEGAWQALEGRTPFKLWHQVVHGKYEHVEHNYEPAPSSESNSTYIMVKNKRLNRNELFMSASMTVNMDTKSKKEKKLLVEHSLMNLNSMGV